MSISSYNFTCSKCDYEDYHNHSVCHIYQGEEECRPVLRTAWCSNCDKIVTMCAPFTEEYALDEINDLSGWIERNKPGIFTWFSQKKRDAVLDAENMLKQVKRRGEYFKGVTFNDKCMSCGSNEIFHVEPPYHNYDEPSKLGVIHSCGGELLAKTGIRVSYSNRQQVVYDKNGNVIS